VEEGFEPGDYLFEWFQDDDATKRLACMALSPDLSSLLCVTLDARVYDLHIKSMLAASTPMMEEGREEEEKRGEEEETVVAAAAVLGVDPPPSPLPPSPMTPSQLPPSPFTPSSSSLPPTPSSPAVPPPSVPPPTPTRAVDATTTRPSLADYAKDKRWVRVRVVGQSMRGLSNAF